MLLNSGEKLLDVEAQQRSKGAGESVDNTAQERHWPNKGKLRNRKTRENYV